MARDEIVGGQPSRISSYCLPEPSRYCFALASFIYTLSQNTSRCLPATSSLFMQLISCRLLFSSASLRFDPKQIQRFIAYLVFSLVAATSSYALLLTQLSQNLASTIRGLPPSTFKDIVFQISQAMSSPNPPNAASPSTPKHPPQIIILGGGISALQTTLTLLTTHSTSHCGITLIAAHLPGDLSSSYTSPWAGGDWHSHASLSDSESSIRAWDARTYEKWLNQLSPSKEYEEEEKPKGLHLKTLRYFHGAHSAATPPSGNGVWFSSLVRDFQILDLANEREEGRPVPKEAVFGYAFLSVVFEPVVYLGWLLGRVRRLGGRVVKERVETSGGLEGVVRHALEIFFSGREGDAEVKGDGSGKRVQVVVNCTGLSARHFLPADEASKLFPIRGQTVLVKGEARDAYTYVSIPSSLPEDLLYVIPRPGSDTTLLGGCKQIGSWEEDVDFDLSERILERVRREGLADELLIKKRNGEYAFEVLKHQVGFRPGRKGGPRVEVESEGDGRVGGVWVVHNYGHGGGGFQASVGCAERAGVLVEGLLEGG